MKTLIVVHCATNTVPGQAPFFSPEGYDDMAIGRIRHAAEMAAFFTGARLYVFIPPDECIWGDSQLNVYHRAKTRLANGPAHVWQAVNDAWVDDWTGAEEAGQPINTAGECMRAVAYAKTHGYGAILPVSTGWGHAPRCGMTMFAEAQKHDIAVLGYAEVPFEGIGKEQGAFFDPPHMKSAPFAQVAHEHQWHVLFPSLFRAFGGDTAKYTGFTDDLVALMKQHGVTNNLRGQPI